MFWSLNFTSSLCAIHTNEDEVHIPFFFAHSIFLSHLLKPFPHMTPFFLSGLQRVAFFCDTFSFRRLLPEWAVFSVLLARFSSLSVKRGPHFIFAFGLLFRSRRFSLSPSLYASGWVARTGSFFVEFPFHLIGVAWLIIFRVFWDKYWSLTDPHGLFFWSRLPPIGWGLQSSLFSFRTLCKWVLKPHCPICFADRRSLPLSLARLLPLALFFPFPPRL